MMFMLIGCVFAALGCLFYWICGVWTRYMTRITQSPSDFYFRDYDGRNHALIIVAAGVVFIIVGIVDYFNLYAYLQPVLKYWQS